jgi:hypothetical protein
MSDVETTHRTDSTHGHSDNDHGIPNELNELVTSAHRATDAHVVAVSELKEIAKKVALGTETLNQGLAEAHTVERDLESKLRKIKKPAFTVNAVDIQGKTITEKTERTKADDIFIEVEDTTVSDEKLAFSVDIDRTLSVIKQVLDTGRNRTGRNWLHWRRHGGTYSKRAKWIWDLKGIAHVGLEHDDPSQVKLAMKLLDTFHEEFVASEAGAVKNRYLARLGMWCLLVSAGSVAGYILASRYLNDPAVNKLRNFWLLAAGAGVGTWLSFALRRVILTFLDLATLEEDQLDPPTRVVFVTALACVVGLSLWTGAINVELGTFNFQLADSGTNALLLGLLLGIAERTMSGSVFKRATGLTGSIAGK